MTWSPNASEELGGLEEDQAMYTAGVHFVFVVWEVWMKMVSVMILTSLEVSMTLHGVIFWTFRSLHGAISIVSGVEGKYPFARNLAFTIFHCWHSEDFHSCNKA